jgi:Protein of unknown function (DUF3703)
MNTYHERIRPHVERELETAATLERQGDLDGAFRHLERAHVLGQRDTYWHVKVHTEMLRVAAKRNDPKELSGQVLRIVGAATKTPLGVYPSGNTGGANVSPIQPMPIPSELQALIDEASTPPT